jgi:hypothetical protein
VNYRILRSLAALALSLSVAAAAPAATHAARDDMPSDETTNLCHYLQQQGHFEGEYLQGFTVSQCVDYFNTPGSEQARNFLMGLCGLDVVRADFGFISHDECVSAFSH